VDNKGKKLKSTGKLPAHVAEPKIFLVDPSHSWHVYGKHLFALNKRNSKFKKADAETHIKNYGYTMKKIEVNHMMFSRKL